MFGNCCSQWLSRGFSSNLDSIKWQCPVYFNGPNVGQMHIKYLGKDWQSGHQLSSLLRVEKEGYSSVPLTLHGNNCTWGSCVRGGSLKSANGLKCLSLCSSEVLGPGSNLTLFIQLSAAASINSLEILHSNPCVIICLGQQWAVSTRWSSESHMVHMNQGKLWVDCDFWQISWSESTFFCSALLAECCSFSTLYQASCFLFYFSVPIVHFWVLQFT